MVVKGDQPGLRWDLEHLFAEAEPPGRTGVVRTVDKGHGRLEVRRLQASTALTSYSDWPHLAQALCLDREVTVLATGEIRRERVYGVTSLPPQQADAAALLALWRGHWGIENRLHWVRDVLFDEDRSGATAGNGPQNAGRPPQHCHRPVARPRPDCHRRQPPPSRPRAPRNSPTPGP